MKKIVSHPLVLALIACLPAIWSLLAVEKPQMHDWTHPARIVELQTALLDGHFPVRWARNLGFGYGAPMFSFYAPLPYYLGAALAFVVTPILAVKLLFIITVIGSFIGIQHAVTTKHKYAGLLAAVAFTYMPYHALNIYVRGALGELFGMMFFIFTWVGIKELAKHKTSKHLVFTAASYAALVLSHNLSIIMGTPFLVLHAVYQIWSAKRPRQLARSYISAILLGLGLASFFLVPMVVERSSIAISELVTGDGDYSKHFVFARQLWDSPWGRGGSIEGIYDGISFEIGKLYLVLGIGAIITLWKNGSTSQKKYGLILSLGLCTALLLTNSRSHMLWEASSYLRFIQFPWRFLFYAGFFLSLLIGTHTGWLTRRPLPVTLLSVSMMVWYLNYFKAAPDTPDYTYNTSRETITSQVSATLPEYLPASLNHLVMGDKTEAPTPISSRFTDQVEIIQDKTHYFEIRVTNWKEADIPIYIFQFPGWRFWIDDQLVLPEIDKKLPYYRIPLPAGYDEHIIKGRLTETPIRRLADVLSLVILAYLRYLMLGSNQKKTS